VKGEAPGKRSSHQLTALGTDLFSPVFSSFFSTTELEWIPLNTSALGVVPPTQLPWVVPPTHLPEEDTKANWGVGSFHAVGNHLISLGKPKNGCLPGLHNVLGLKWKESPADAGVAVKGGKLINDALATALAGGQREFTQKEFDAFLTSGIGLKKLGQAQKPLEKQGDIGVNEYVQLNPDSADEQFFVSYNEDVCSGTGKPENALVYKFLPSTMEWTEIGTLPPNVTTDTDIMEDSLDMDAAGGDMSALMNSEFSGTREQDTN